MGLMSYRVKTPFLTRCDLCHHGAHSFYKVQLGDQEYHFCSGAHANVAAKNYYDKIAKGINPTPVPDEEMPQDEL